MFKVTPRCAKCAKEIKGNEEVYVKMRYPERRKLKVAHCITAIAVMQSVCKGSMRCGLKRFCLLKGIRCSF
ncbi:hypothetical protein DS031_17985 [Bacillus taeanensis]|uniref:Uncharacterized protein n=1 Tax=Bacillus taeanensis TaxID=273032 RepID=A0A366XQ71_9BACI|nr:hypothetical protein DS031_17985 [Bacillus taeanensis]